MTERQIPILVYHHVYAEEEPDLAAADIETGAGVIGVDAFRQQMAHIRDSGWLTVSTTDIVDWLEGVGDLPEKSFGLHFDNGWLDTLTTALPAAAEFGYTATCFPITDGVEAASEGKAGGSAHVDRRSRRKTVHDLGPGWTAGRRRLGDWSPYSDSLQGCRHARLGGGSRRRQGSGDGQRDLRPQTRECAHPLRLPERLQERAH